MTTDTDSHIGRSILHFVCTALLGLFAGYGAFTLGYQVRNILTSLYCAACNYNICNISLCKWGSSANEWILRGILSTQVAGGILHVLIPMRTYSATVPIALLSVVHHSTTELGTPQHII